MKILFITLTIFFLLQSLILSNFINFILILNHLKIIDLYHSNCYFIEFKIEFNMNYQINPHMLCLFSFKYFLSNLNLQHFNYSLHLFIELEYSFLPLPLLLHLRRHSYLLNFSKHIAWLFLYILYNYSYAFDLLHCLQVIYCLGQSITAVLILR